MIFRHVTAIVLATAWLISAGCGAGPRMSARASREVIYSRPPAHAAASLEAPREAVAALQTCADRYAPHLSSDMYAILFDVEKNTSGQITAVKIKDSMLNGSDIEECLTGVLELMVVPGTATNTRHNVSTQSRSMIGVVQAAAAPIALLPIVLVAAGVTILVGVTIYVATQAIDAGSETARCREVKEKCIAHCSGPAGLPAPGGGRFRGCMRECMESQGCSF